MVMAVSWRILPCIPPGMPADVGPSICYHGAELAFAVLYPRRMIG
jgi:hypothetical protein